MKKTVLALLCTCLLLLAACRARPLPEETPSPTPEPTPSQTQTLPPDPGSSQTPGDETTAFPQILEEFPFSRARAWISEGGTEYPIIYRLTGEEPAQLKAALAMDTWWAADTLPPGGFHSHYTLYDEDGRFLLVAECDEEKSLIEIGDDSFSSCFYYAPPSVLDALVPFLDNFSFLPGLDRYFDYDQIKIGRTPCQGKEGYRDHDIYLLEDTQRLALRAALALDSWAEAQIPAESAAIQRPALELLDPQGNRILLTDWGEDRCLISCFLADAYWRRYDPGLKAVLHYWAPASALKNVQDLAEGLTPLGVMDSDAARYYDLFQRDRGFEMVMRDANKQGIISDDMMAAYVFYVTDYDCEIGISPETVDAVTQKHFGRKMGSYDTAWSYVLPSGNMTPSGWDSGSGYYPILEEISDTDKYGNVTATFQVYGLPEHLWLEEMLPASQLSHVREYLLTGNGAVFLKDEWCQVFRVSITFRIETEEVDGAEKEYVVYSAVRLLEA